MGVYLFNADVLIPVLLKDAEDPNSSHDFGKDILPKMVNDYRVFAYDFLDENKKEALYWRDVGTLEAYYEANMDIVSVSPIFNLYDHRLAHPHPPAPVSAREVRVRGKRSYGHGARFHRVERLHRFRRRVKKSILSPDVRVNSYRKSTSASCSRTSLWDAIAASAAASSTATFTCRREQPSAMTPKPTARATSSPRAASPSSPATTRSSRTQ